MKFSWRSWILGVAAASGAVTCAQAGIAEHVTVKHASGVELFTYRMDVKDVVTLVGSLPAGDVFAVQDAGNPALATLAGMMLDKGTTQEDKFAVAERLADVGASLRFSVDTQTVAIQGRALKKDLATLIQILAEELREPAFSEQEFALVKTQLAGSLREALESTDYRALEQFLTSVFPAGHPNRPVALTDWLASLDAATLDDVKTFYHKCYGPKHLKLVFVGDVDEKAIRADVTKAFAGWTGGVEALRSTPGGEIRTLREQKIPIAQKTSVTVLIGEPDGLTFRDQDALALRVGTAVLGSGFTGRLMSTVRDQEGLTYSIGASLGEDDYVDGTFLVKGSFAPSLLDKGVASTRRELEKWWQDGITADELERRKTNLVGSYEVGLSTTGGMANAILTTLERGKPLLWLDDFPDAIYRLTLEEVNAAIRQHIDPKKLVLIEAGSFSDAAGATEPTAPKN